MLRRSQAGTAIARRQRMSGCGPGSRAATRMSEVSPVPLGSTGSAPFCVAGWRLLWQSALLVLLSAGVGLGCQKTYYTVLEKVGVEKRELLERRVEKAQESQQEAQDTFRDALEEFQAVAGHDGGTLERRYERLSDAYDSSEAQAEEVGDRIDAVENVGSALLDEWEQELEAYHDDSLRRKSSRKLRATRDNFEGLLETMRRAEESLEPVLTKLHDHVLYLKHNLNAQALQSLDEDIPELKRDVERLIVEMEASIAEANRFIAELG